MRVCVMCAICHWWKKHCFVIMQELLEPVYMRSLISMVHMCVMMCVHYVSAMVHGLLTCQYSSEPLLLHEDS